MRTLFWDFDGTLVHSDHLWSTSVYNALRSVDENTHVTFLDIRGHMAHGFTWQTPERDYRHLLGEAWWDFMLAHIENSYRASGVPYDVAAEATARVRAQITDPAKYNLYPDTIEALVSAQKNGFQNVLLTNNYPDLQSVLDALDLPPYLDGTIISALEGYDKPRTELFDIAKERYPSSFYAMIGDNPVADIDGGNTADMTTVLVHKGAIPAADFCCDSLTEAVAWLTERSNCP